MATRPLDGATPKYPNFATADVQESPENGGQWNVQEPSSEVKASGWRRLERPPRYWLNWLHRLYNQWIQWFDQEVEYFRTVLNVMIPGLINDLDGRLDTLETTVNTTVDGRLDTLETSVNTTIEGRLDELESFETNIGAQYALPSQTGTATFEMAGLSGGDVMVYANYVLHSAYNIAGSPQKVTLLIPGVSGASAAYAKFESPFSASDRIPAAIRPSADVVIPIIVLDNSVPTPGSITIEPDGDVRVRSLGSTDFSTSGTKGFASDTLVEYYI